MIATLITRDAPAQSGTRYVPDRFTATMDGGKKVGTPADSLNRVIVGLSYTREIEGD